MIIVKEFSNKTVLLKLSNLTDFSYATKQVKDLCIKAYELINENSDSSVIETIGSDLASGVFACVKEKASVTYYIFENLSCKHKVYIYKHRKVTENPFLCMKALLLITENQLNAKQMIGIASMALSIKFADIFVYKAIDIKTNCSSIFGDNIHDSVAVYADITREYREKLDFIYTVL